MYANFMKHNFKNYFAPDGKGSYKKVNRGDCFVHDAESFKGKYPQRWYWDEENDFVIRLERNEAGRKIHNENRAERRRAWKAYVEEFGCVRKECLECKGWDVTNGGESKCDSCIKHISLISLDEEIDSTNGEKGILFEVAADVNVECQVESNHLLETLQKVLRTLDDDDRVLWRFLVADTKKKVIAAHFGWTLDKLSYRQLKLYTKLRSNQALKNFF